MNLSLFVGFSRPELRARGADGGGAPAAGVAAAGPKPVPHPTGPSQQPALQQSRFAGPGGAVRTQQTRAVHLSGNKYGTERGKIINLSKYSYCQHCLLF